MEPQREQRFLEERHLSGIVFLASHGLFLYCNYFFFVCVYVCVQGFGNLKYVIYNGVWLRDPGSSKPA